MTQALSELLVEGTRLKSMSSITGVGSHSVLAAAQNCFAKFLEKLVDFRARCATRGRGA
jgi:hypothetical protein